MPGIAPFTISTDRQRFDWLAKYGEVFGDRLYALAELSRGADDDQALDAMTSLARRARTPLVAANDVHYHATSRRLLQDVLTAVRLKTTVAKAVEHLFPNGERRLLSPREMLARFARRPDAVVRTLEVADRCTFSLDELRYEYPDEICPPGLSPREHLANLVRDGAAKQYGGPTPEKVQRMIDHELQIIAELRYEHYFLTVYDLVRHAREKGILCQGRGSAANSAVCFCLGVTAVDPNRPDVHLLFERFISVERKEAPDIDIDFEHERREEVIQYVYNKYGRDRAGMTAEVITYRPKSAVRDVGKALGLSLDRVDRLAKTLGHWDEGEPFAERFREAGLDPETPTAKRLIHLVRELIGFPRHLSQHVGGMVLTRALLCETVPIENAAMPDRTVIQWDKDDLDELGILKVDCLGLGMLTAIRKCLELVEKWTGKKWTLATIPEDDEEVYEMIQRADTVGVFQIESRAQMSMLPRLRPKCYYDLVIQVAIVRPGPIVGGMVHPYLRRRKGLEPVDMPKPELEPALKRTLGVPIFQEQVMQISMIAAGFTGGQADQLRRAMAAWKRKGGLERFRDPLINGMLERGYTQEFAERIYKQAEGFGEYGFPESHAASFGWLAYASSWLKCHYPAAFTAAVLNSLPMGFYAPAQLVADAKRHGVVVYPTDVNVSDWDSTLEPLASSQSGFAIRLGLCRIRGIKQREGDSIVAGRAGGPYRSVGDLARRANLERAALLLLARADALGSLDYDRRAGLWQASSWHRPRERQPTLFAEMDPAEPPVRLSPEPPLDAVTTDYHMVELSLRAHPVQFLRPQLAKRRVVTAKDTCTIPNGRRVCVAGVVVVRQQPGTAKGIRFMTLEDETGVVNLIVKPPVYKRDRYASRSAPLVLAEGVLQNVEDVVHVLAARLEDISPLLVKFRSQSRDFR
jgi:error-prone DNA polymerase